MSVSSPEGREAQKPPKSGGSRRKISLPWFRQASIGERLTRLTVRRQQTVDPAALAGSGSPPLPSGRERMGYVRRKLMSASASIEVSRRALSPYRAGPPAGYHSDSACYGRNKLQTGF
jgi:hypothetical protein